MSSSPEISDGIGDSERVHLSPHRGVMILCFGILSWFLCPIFGVVAWVMANGDLRQMEAGTMDMSGKDMTKTGKILGMVNVILVIGVLFLILLFMLLMVFLTPTLPAQVIVS